MNYNSMTVQSNSPSRAAEANASRNGKDHQKAPIREVRYRDESEPIRRHSSRTYLKIMRVLFRLLSNLISYIYSLFWGEDHLP